MFGTGIVEALFLLVIVIVATSVFFLMLYLIVRAAVRDGIRQADSLREVHTSRG